MYDAIDLIFEEQERSLLTLPAPQPLKGRCRYCGKAVARGIFAHEKSCAKKVAT